MKFAVLGAGAIGAYVGAALAARRRRRHARSRAARTCAAMQSNGVRVRQPARRLHRPPGGDRRPRRPSADADVVFVGAEGLQPAGARAPPRRGCCRPGRAGDLGAERHPLVVLPVAPGPLDGTVLERRPGRGDQPPRSPPERVDRLRRLLLDRDRRARGRSATSRAPASASASRTASERALPADLRGASPPGGLKAPVSRRPPRPDLAQARRQRRPSTR